MVLTRIRYMEGWRVYGSDGIILRSCKLYGSDENILRRSRLYGSERKYLEAVRCLVLTRIY